MTQPYTSHPGRLPKLSGGDYEFQNLITGIDRPDGSGFEASRLLLLEIDGYAGEAAISHGATGSLGELHRADEDRPRPNYYSQDWGRRFLTNGSCFYIDLNHLEGCIPEVLSARDHVAACHALFHHAHQAAVRANARLRPGCRLHVIANNSDGHGNSFGTHLSFLVTRAAWDQLFHRKPHQQLALAAFQASLQVITGQGKVGSENGRPAVAYQISQRADYFEVLCGLQTTYNRPIVNSRDETLCGEWRAPVLQDPVTRGMARLHCIFFDNNLCHVAAFLKVGCLQIFLAMLEAGVVPAIILDDAVDAVVRWSHDPDLHATAPLMSGEDVTAVALQRRFFEAAAAFVATGACAGLVPDAEEILRQWDSVLTLLERRDFAALAGRLDWVLKRGLLEQAMRRKPGLTWASPEIKYLDHQYANLDPDAGLYWACERAGAVERIVSAADVARFVKCPPENTRAWTRAALLTLADPEQVDAVDWDSVRFRFNDPTRWMPRYRTVRLGNPLAHTKADARRLFPESGRLADVIEALGADDGLPPAPATASGLSEWPITRHSTGS